MVNMLLIDHIMSVVTEPNEDNTYTIWPDVEIQAGSVIINDEQYVYIKAKELSDYKETLVDISLPIAAFDKCSTDIRQFLIDTLIEN